MKYRLTVPVIVIILSIACLSANFFVNSLAGYFAISCVLLILFFGYIKHLNNKAAIERKNLLESIQRTAISTLAHHRHDWMNDLQILYGYIQLGKYDKLTDCVERIKERVAAEGKISRLGIPSLVFFLQSFREVNSSIQLEVCVQENLHLDELLSVSDGEELSVAIMESIRAYQFTSRSTWGEILRLKLTLSQIGNEVMAIIERQGVEGTLGCVETIKKLIEDWSMKKSVQVEQMDSEWTSLRLRITCGNLNEVNTCL